MRLLLRVAKRFSNTLNVVAAALLTIMMLLTVIDVILRYLGRPITGTFELMAFAGALVTGLALAQTSLDDAQVNVDIVVQAISEKAQKILFVFNRFLGLGIFGLLGWALFDKGNDLYMTGEVSLTLHVPYYPVAYGLAFCCLVECLALFSTMLKAILGGQHE
jgi:TRAP-type C4-dicarboxylate transport system permease small subunit